MIPLTLSGLAKYMTATPANQRKILREFKYPNEDEPYAMRLYYREAREHIVGFHRNGREREWLLQRSHEIDRVGELNGGISATRLKHNSRVLRQYAKHFAERPFEVLDTLRLSLVFGDVRLSVVPDLHVRERGKEKIVKLDFGVRQPSEEVVKIISQCMFEAARGEVEDLTSSSALYLDVGRGTEHRGARAGARIRADIEAACETISAVWPLLQPRCS